MKAHRIYAIILRFQYLIRHSYERLSDIFYWVIMDIVLWGLTSVFFREYLKNDLNVTRNLLGGLVLWYVIWRTQYEISVNVLEEIWNKNLINIFASPITFFEWIIAFMISGVVKVFMMLSVAILVMYFIYNVNFLDYGLYLFIFIPLLMVSGWTIGFFIASLLLRFGTRLQTLAWSFPYLLNPFSAIFYPLTILPLFAQNIARALPTSYVFESARSVINTGSADPKNIMISLLLNILYFAISLYILNRSFKKMLQKGITKLY